MKYKVTMSQASRAVNSVVDAGVLYTAVCSLLLIPSIIFAFRLSLSPSLDVSQAQGHEAGSLSPLPATVPAFVFRIARRLLPFLRSSTRIVLRLQ